MKKTFLQQFLFAVFLLYCIGAKATDDLITEQVVVKMEQAGTLASKISDTDKYRITNLKITGAINGDDLNVLRSMSLPTDSVDGKLQKLDLLDAHVVAGGKCYYSTPEVDQISSSAFYGCTSLVSVSLPKSVKDIDYAAFGGCKSLKTILLPDSLKNLGGSLGRVFAGCDNLLSIVIPQGVTCIEGQTFTGCEKLSSIFLPNTLKRIENRAFSNCKSLTSLSVPDSLCYVAQDAFVGCELLENLYVNDLSTWVSNSHLSWLYVENVNSKLFINGKLLVDAVIPTGVRVIKPSVFSGYSYLKSVEIPNTVNTIGAEAFVNCVNLSSVSLSEGLVSILNGAFKGCVGMTSIKIPSSIEELHNNVFAGCANLKSLYLCAESPITVTRFATSSSDEVSFEDLDIENITLYVPKGSLQTYKNAKTWRLFKNIEEYDCKPNKQCFVPTITYISGNLSFESSTPGAEYRYSINDADVASDKYNTDGQVQLNGKLEISVYATADGYKASDKATATLYWLNADGEDETDNINLVKTRGVMVTTDSGITISGLNDGEAVTFYSVSGVNLGSAKAVQGVAHFEKPNESIVIVKIKGNDLKIDLK